MPDEGRCLVCSDAVLPETCSDGRTSLRLPIQACKETAIALRNGWRHAEVIAHEDSLTGRTQQPSRTTRRPTGALRHIRPVALKTSRPRTPDCVDHGPLSARVRRPLPASDLSACRALVIDNTVA